MDTEAVAGQIEEMGGKLGLDGPSIRRIVQAMKPVLAGVQSQIQQLTAENARLREDLQRTQAEKDRLAKVQAEVADLLKAKSPDAILHDLRNALNELTLLQAIANAEG